jgi:orotate phosphoribosyltransferase-like protein
MKKNNDIRELAKKNGVYLYEIAMELNVSESTFIKSLRKELTDEKKEEIKQIINQLSE